MSIIRNVFTALACVLLAAMALSVVGCSDSDNPVAPPATLPAELDQIVDAGNAYLTAGKAPTMTASDLYNNLNDGNATNDPYVLSIRSAADYAAGHIPTAQNIGYRDIAKPASLASLPVGRQIVVACYTGHTASQTTMFLNMMGYDAVAMKFGMMSWTIDPADNPSVATTQPYDHTLDCGDYPVSAAAVTPGSNALPTVENTTSTTASEVIRVAVDDYLTLGKSPAIKAVDVYNNLNDGNATNDPFVLSVRGATDYNLGHVTGAVNIPWRDIADKAELAKLPTNQQIVVICYTGHTASIVTMFLNSLGYDAIAMKWGMTSWTVDPAKNPSIATIRYYDPALDCGDYPCGL